MSEQPVPGELRVVTITAILHHGKTISVDSVVDRVPQLPGIKIYTERVRDTSLRTFSKHVSLLVSLPGREKPVNVKVFERKVQCTGLKSDREIELLQLQLRDILASDDLVWTVDTPLRNGFFYLPHPKDEKVRATVHDMVSFCNYIRDALRREGESKVLVSYDPQVVRGIKIAIPGLGTGMVSSTGCCWLLGTRSHETMTDLHRRLLGLFRSWWSWLARD